MALKARRVFAEVRWRGPAKKTIIELVKVTTDRASPKFVPPEARIATFDQDGTTWVEHPMYTQVVYCLERVPAVVAKKPELKNVEPFKTVLSGNREAMAKLSMKDLEKILVATLTGMTVDEFKAEVAKWIATAKHPRWGRLYTELTYQPMLEAMHYLRDKLDSIDGYGPRRRTTMSISVSSSDGRPSTISHRLVIRRLSEKLDDHQPRCQHPRNTLIDVASNDRRGRGSCCG